MVTHSNCIFILFSDLNSSTALWSSYNIWLEASIVAVIFTICVVVFLVGCLDCCRNSRFNFKVNTNVCLVLSFNYNSWH